MSAQVAPTIPPRPTKASERAAAQGVSHLPDIPPRPIPKRLDRSVSPGHYPGSPLNEPFNPLSRSLSRDEAAQPQLLKRPSVVQLPSVGQEGMEYAETQYVPQLPVSALGADAAAQTRNVAQDLHLHAPTPSLPKSAATAQVQAVTRTDSQQAAALGIGKPDTPGHEDHPEHEFVGRVRSRASFSRPNSSASGGRRSSVVYGEEQGPAELGMRVPINPLLGDVQAPSPAPFTPNHTGQNGEARRHNRKKSAQHGLPPGSYGLHGHGVPTADPFERDWYAKHPEELVHEEAHGHGVYEGIGSGRGAFALSSDDLNKIVHDTANRGAGFGTTGNTVSYPDEQIGYMASEDYVSRVPPVAPTLTLTKTLTNQSQPSVESPLRKSSMPAEDIDPVVEVRNRHSSAGHEDPVHIAPKDRYNKLTGGEETMHETGDSKSSTGHHDEDGQEYSVPILAVDLVAKESSGDFMHPAISPRIERRSSNHEYEHRSGEITPTSRPSSRPGSIYGLHSASHSLSRFISHHDDRDTMHTPLEDVDEYEPLFADEDSKQKALSHADRFKPRPDALRHRFPSQDIWEDAPSSVNFTATVTTPDLPAPTQQAATSFFESPEAEAARKGEPSEDEKKKLMPAEERLAKSKFAPHLRDDMPTRPGMQPRFPSQDIWEDSPESYHLVATVQSPPLEDAPVDYMAKPIIPPRPVGKSRLGDGASSSSTAPSIPARPAKKTVPVPPVDTESTDPGALSKQISPVELKKVPSIPDRPKPQVPPRPGKKTSAESLSKTISIGSVDSQGTEKAAPITSPPVTKAKPQVPARPAGNAKFAGLKGNFMNDLNQKLGLGPPKEKEPEPEVEAKPLEDARKSRARGPQRRAPAKSPTAHPASQFSMFKPTSLWHIDEEGLLNSGSLEGLTQAEDIKVLEQDAEAAEVLDDEPLIPSSHKIEAVDHDLVGGSTSAEKESKASLEAERIAEDTSTSIAPSSATNSAAEFADPSLQTPTLEKDNQLSRNWTHASDGTGLTQESTASAGSGHPLEREIPNPATDAIPASKQTTASTTISGTTMERKVTNPPEEEIQLRNEQVGAPAPGPGSSELESTQVSGGGLGKADPVAIKMPVQPSAADVGVSQTVDTAAEGGITDAQLEAMVHQADGTIHHGDVQSILTKEA